MKLLKHVPTAWQPYFNQGQLDGVGRILAGQPRNSWHPRLPRQIFRPLELTAPDAFSVFLLGQDPYPAPGYPTGLPFEVTPTVPRKDWPLALKNIDAELAADVGRHLDRTNVRRWAKSGCLLWNVAPTCGIGGVSHRGRAFGWRAVTQRLIRSIAEERPVVFMCWGRVAHRLVQRVAATNGRPLVFAYHPASRGLFPGERPFSRVNEETARLRLPSVDW
jgi:uracil-DNA glycosylase